MASLRRKAANTPTAADPDAVLVSWARQNPQAFTALYDRYFAAIHGYCLSQLGDPGAAEDATSQTFLKALAALPGYREAGRFRSWLFAIAHNAILDTIRAQRAADHLEAAAGVHDPAPPPEEQAIASFDAAWLDGVIARLPADDRHVLELRRAGLSGREIAAVLGISHEAAKKRQLRAIDQIRADIASPGNREVRRGA
jgi:RNA polymerase sigma-70 factor (ECF subfamily)